MPHALSNKLSEIGTLRLIPNTLALMAVQRQAATSKSTKPSSNVQHLLDSWEPITTFTNPKTSAHTPSFKVSLGQEGFAGGPLGGGHLGGGIGFVGLHVPQASENETLQMMRKKMKIPHASEVLAMARE